MDAAISRLARSRAYHILTSGVSLSVCLFSPYAFKGSVSIPIWVSVFVGALSVDALLRYIVFGINSTLATVDLVATSICANFVIFDAVFVSGKLMGLQNILVVASMLRCIVAGQHSVTYKRAIKPVPRKLVVEERPSTSQSSKKELDLSYITSRIVAVSKSSFSSPEHVFLESKYANFLKCLPQLESDSINPLSTIGALADSAARHLLGNPVNVVSVITCGGDPNGVLVVCAILLRMGSVYPRTARNALNLFIRQRYVIEPDRDSLLPKCLASQLGMLESKMAGTTPQENALYLKRVVVSDFSAEDALDLRLSIVDIGTGRVLEDTIAPSVSSTSLTFVCGASLLGEDSILVFSSDQTADPVISKLYVNTKHHFERIIASTWAFHFVSSFENCDHWAPWRFKNSSARIELVASTESDNIGNRASGKNRYEKALLQIPPFQQQPLLIV